MHDHRNNHGSSMNTAIAVVAVIVILGFGYYFTQQPTPTPSNQNANTAPSGGEGDATMEKKTFTLSEQNASGESGSVAIIGTEDGVQVVMNVTGAPTGVEQPAHIHSGKCETIGAVKYPLTNVVNGSSMTVLPVSYEELFAQLPLSINVHKSTTELSTYVACGNLDGSEVMPAEGGSASAGMNKNESGNDASASGEMNKNETGDGTSAAGETNKNEGAMMGAEKTITLTGRNFAFSQSEIRIKKGDKVTIKFSSTDGFHDWVVDELNAATAQVNTGGAAEVTFTADKAGTFEYYCSVGKHRQMGMVGKLIVE